jgi:hypothetical protein
LPAAVAVPVRLAVAYQQQVGHASHAN